MKYVLYIWHGVNINTPVTLGATTSKDKRRPLNSWQSLPVLGEVADGLPMVSDDLWWSLVVAATIWSYRGIWWLHQIPLYDKTGRARSLVVFNQSFMGQGLPYDSFQKLAEGFTGRRSLMASDQHMTSISYQLPTSSWLYYDSLTSRRPIKDYYQLIMIGDLLRQYK